MKRLGFFITPKKCMRCTELTTQLATTDHLNRKRLTRVLLLTTTMRIPDRIAPSAETNCNPKPEFAAGGAGTSADSMTIYIHP
ncbi:MAG: hypothetical protein AB2792_00825 [Candidatus Thiodiazotropha sp.]